jgi:hypothetical protein
MWNLRDGTGPEIIGHGRRVWEHPGRVLDELNTVTRSR